MNFIVLNCQVEEWVDIFANPVFKNPGINKLCWWAALLKFWFQTDLERKNSASYYRRGKELLLLSFIAMVTRWSRSMSYFYDLIGQNWTVVFRRKIYAASGNLFTDSWSWQSFVPSSCDVFNCLSPLDVQNKMQLSCYQDSSIIHGWFVYWLFGWDMRRSSKSSGIRFQRRPLSFLTLLDA